MKKRKTIPDGKYRVIKISRDALFDFIYEAFTERLEDFLDVSDPTSVVTTFDMDWERGSFLCVARNERGEDEHLQMEGIDTAQLLSKMKDTTDTLFSDGRFVELTEDELIEIQNRRTQQEKDGQKCLEYLQNADLASLSLDGIIKKFEKMCEMPLENPSVLFEAGTFGFTDEPLFTFSLIRQFPQRDGGEYWQIRVNILYEPSEKTEPFPKPFSNVLWDFAEEENIFDCIRESDEYKALQDEPIYRIEVMMEET